MRMMEGVTQNSGRFVEGFKTFTTKTSETTAKLSTKTAVQLTKVFESTSESVTQTIDSAMKDSSDIVQGTDWTSAGSDLMKSLADGMAAMQGEVAAQAAQAVATPNTTAMSASSATASPAAMSTPGETAAIGASATPTGQAALPTGAISSVTPAASPAMPSMQTGGIQGVAANAASSLFAQTQDAIQRGVKYGFGSKDSKTGRIDCSGWVAEINGNLIDSVEGGLLDAKSKKQLKNLYTGGAAGTMQAASQFNNQLLEGGNVNQQTLKEGMMIGEDNGALGWDKGRWKGIDHITQVVKDAKTGEMMISQSSGGNKTGKVSLQKLSDYLAYKNKKGVKLYATMSPVYAKLGNAVAQSTQIESQAAQVANTGMEQVGQAVNQASPPNSSAIAATPTLQTAMPSMGIGAPGQMMTETTPMTPQPPNLQGMIGQIGNIPLLDLIKNPKGALDGLKQQVLGAFSGDGGAGLSQIIQQFNPDGIKEKLHNVFGQVKEGFVGQLKQINLSNALNINGLMSSFGNIFKTGLSGIGDIFGGLLGGKGGLGGMLGGLLGGEKSGGLGGMLSGVLGGDAGGGIGGLVGGLFGGEKSSGGGIGGMLDGIFGGDQSSGGAIAIPSMANVFNPGTASTPNLDFSGILDTIGSKFSSVTQNISNSTTQFAPMSPAEESAFGDTTQPTPIPTVESEPTPIPAVSPSSEPKSAGNSAAPITVNITVNVNGGGGEGGDSKFDPMVLAQKIREQVELGLADAQRASIYDID